MYAFFLYYTNGNCENHWLSVENEIHWKTISMECWQQTLNKNILKLIIFEAEKWRGNLYRHSDRFCMMSTWNVNNERQHHYFCESQTRSFIDPKRIELSFRHMHVCVTVYVLELFQRNLLFEIRVFVRKKKIYLCL